MNIRFERRMFILKSLLLVLFFVLILAILGGQYGQRFDAELMGMVFATIIGALIVIEYLQLFPSFMKRLFHLSPYTLSEDSSERLRVFVLHSCLPMSLSFS